MSYKNQKGSATIEAALISLFFLSLLKLCFVVLGLAAGRSLVDHFSYEANICVLEGQKASICKKKLQKRLKTFRTLFVIKEIHLAGQSYYRSISHVRIQVLKQELQISKSLDRADIRKAVRWYKP